MTNQAITNRYKGVGRPKKTDYMTEREAEEILAKAIKKAQSNGYDIRNRDYHNATGCEGQGYLDIVQASRVLCFSHDFAKAFWGDADDYSSEILYPYIQGYEWEFTGFIWEAHLMRMALEKDPISYLEKFI